MEDNALSRRMVNTVTAWLLTFYLKLSCLDALVVGFDKGSASIGFQLSRNISNLLTDS